MFKILKLSLKAIAIILAGTVAIIAAVVLLNVLGSLVFNYVPFIANLENKGSLGDAINGLSAPVITLFSAVLIYYTFKEQIKANRLLSAQNQLDTFFKLYAQIERGISTLEYTNLEPHRDPITHSGNVAIIVFLAEIKRMRKREQATEFLNKLVLLCEDIIVLTEHIKKSEVDAKDFFYSKLNTVVTMHFGFTAWELAGALDDVPGLLQDTPLIEKYRNCFNRFQRTASHLQNTDLGKVFQSNEEFQIEEEVIREKRRQFIEKREKRERKKMWLYNYFPSLRRFIKPGPKN